MNYLLKFSLFLLIFVAFQAAAFSQEVLGKWKVTNEQGRVNSIVEIYKNGQAYYGKVVRITKEEDRDKRCEKCPGELKDAPIEGLNVIRGFEKEGDEYVNGILLDPKSGKEYKGKIWIDENDPDKLNVRGYIAFFYKTKTWERAE
jgi:uncharacterized protein (DUF2147 family)